MKKHKCLPALPKRSIFKILLLMKFMVVFILLSNLQVSARPFSQDRITLNLQSAGLKTALKQIEKQTIFRFLYNDEVVSSNYKVSINAINKPVTEVLDNIFTSTALTYRILENNLVVITSKEQSVQDIRVTGKVTSSTGETIPGVTVTIKGSTVTTTTNAAGVYSITTPENATLVFSSVGYTTLELPVNGRTELDVTLQTSTVGLNEVVVIGYGTANKRDLTGSVSRVRGQDLAIQPNANAVSSLQSKVAGVNIVNSAIPGAAPDVRIRGTISVGTIRPVYIIDGIFSDNMDFVNPNEIESIEILKDPSSLAVFGIKGAAGAILVTTKKAKAGQTLINFNTTYGSKQLVDKIAMANGQQFRDLLTFEANNRIQDDPSATSLQDFINNGGLTAYNGNTDWVDAVSRTATFATANLSVDASTEKNRFHFGLGYTYDEGMVKHVLYDRLNINLNDEFKVSKVLKLGFGIIGSRERLPYNSDALEQGRRALPIIPDGTKSFFTKNPYGIDSNNYNLYAQTPIIQNSESNPMATLETFQDKKVDSRDRLVGNVFVDLTITKELNFRSTWYGNLSWRNNREYTPLYDLYDPMAAAGSEIINRNVLTAVRHDIIQMKDFQQDYIATYKKKFGDHNFNATAGFTTFYHSYEAVAGSVSQRTPGIGIIPNNRSFWYLNNGFGGDRTIITSGANASGQDEYSTVSGLARVLYNYKNKYYLNGTFRRDGSSQINQDLSKKWQNFWAVGVAWELTKEDFMANQKIFDFLKLKASTGLQGNFTAQGKAYPAYPTISATASATFGQYQIPVYEADYLFDPNLKWETVRSSEVGIEATAFNNRLRFEASYYEKKTQDLIVLLTPVGVKPTLTNSGDIKNNGFEFAASWSQSLNKDLSFSIGGNLTTYKNEVVYLPFPLRTNISSSEQTPNQAETGYPIGYFYGLISDGIYQSYTEILKSPVSTINGGNARPGDIKYRDLNGDDIVNDQDRTLIGNPTPDFTYGINASVKYKAFELGIDLNGSYGNEIFRVWGTSEQKNSVYNYPAYYTEGWTGPGTSNWVPIVNASHLINRAPSTYGIEDGSYVRIRNINLSYTISTLPKTTYIKNLRLTFGIQNLKTWKNNIGYSPEFTGDATSFGIDYGSAGSALPRVITAGLNVNF